MPVLAYPFIRFVRRVPGESDATLTIAAGTGTPGVYTLAADTWSPAVPPWRRGAFGSVTFYEDVEEELAINIRGSDVADTYAKLHDLERFLLHGEHFTHFEPVGSLTLEYAPQGSTRHSTSVPLIARVLGQPEISLPPDWMRSGITGVIPDVRIRFRRLGVWLDTTNNGAAASATNFGDIATISFSTPWLIGGPIDLSCSVGTQFAGTLLGASMLACTSGAIVAVEAEGLASGAYSSVADSANNARGGNVLRYTPAGTSLASSALSGSVLDSKAMGYHVIGMLRNNSSSRQFQALITGYDKWSFPIAQTEVIVTDDANHNPTEVKPVYFGYMPAPNASPVDGFGGFDKFRVRCQVDSTSGSPTLDFDVFYFVPERDDTSVVALDTLDFSAGSVPGGTSLALAFLHHLTDGQQPSVTIRGGSPVVELPIGITGPTLLQSKPVVSSSQQMQVLWAMGGTQWRPTSGTTFTYTPTITRPGAYIVPE